MAQQGQAHSRPAGAGRDRFEDYIPVAERIEQFYSKHPEGRINTTILQHDLATGFILFKAEAYRTPDDAQPAATGHAYEYKDFGFVQKTSYIEVCETSSVGRALAFLNFETKRGIASREEMQNVAHSNSGVVQAKVMLAEIRNIDELPPGEAKAELIKLLVTLASKKGTPRSALDGRVNQRFETDGGLDNCSLSTLKGLIFEYVKARPEVDAELKAWLQGAPPQAAGKGTGR